MGVELRDRIGRKPSGVVVFTSIRVVDFRLVTPETEIPPVPTARASGLNPARHGNWAQWAAVAIAILNGVVNICLTLWSRSSDKERTSTDEHVTLLINNAIQPGLKTLNTNIDTKFETTNQRLTDLTGRVGNVEGQLEMLRSRVAKQATDQQRLDARMDQQEALGRLQDPNRMLATIRAEIQIAQQQGKELPASQLADYRTVVRALPQSAHEYWETVAAIINYQSLLNQMSGEAPDPAKVARPCTGAMIMNVFYGVKFKGCVIDLDPNEYQGGLFENCVIRYRGGFVRLVNVAFINCRFVLDFPPQARPAPGLLYAILDSPDQKTVRVGQ